MFVDPKFCISFVLIFSWGHFNSQEKLRTKLMQNFGVTNKEHYGMLWYFLEWSIHCFLYLSLAFFYELCNFPQIVWSDTIWSQLCEITPSRNAPINVNPVRGGGGVRVRGRDLTNFKRFWSNSPGLETKGQSKVSKKPPPQGKNLYKQYYNTV